MANHCIKRKQGSETHTWRFGIDEASRLQMQKTTTLHREQTVSDGLQLTFEVEHWNRQNRDKDPINLELDLIFDVELRKLTANDDDKAA